MVSVTGTDFEIAPDVPVTVMVTVDDPPVWALEVAPHPAAAKENTNTTSKSPKTPSQAFCLLVCGLRLRVVNTVPINPKAGHRPVNTTIP